MRDLRLAATIYAISAILLWPFPVIGILHVESAAIISLVAFFLAGVVSMRQLGRRMRLGQVVTAHVGVLLIPAALLTLATLWRPNCDYLRGLGFYLLFAVPSVLLAVGVAFVIVALRVRRKRLLFVLVGALTLLAGVVHDVGLHPQFYTYNHIFGGILGPIYDEQLVVRSGLFVFRALTLLWCALLFLVGTAIHANTRGRRTRAAVGCIAVALVIGIVYLNSARLGLNTPSWYLADELGAVARSDHFEIYYSAAGSTSGQELRRIMDEAEYRYERLSDTLGVAPKQTVAVFLYPNRQEKARLIGTRAVSVTPVWLADPQLHLVVDDFDDSFGHELVHVFSREFGIPWIRASASAGLLEGLAVALEPPSLEPSPDRVVAAVMQAAELSPDDWGRRMAKALSPAGFWTGRGAVSYTTTGSFVAFLLREHGVEALKKAYPWGRFRQSYGTDVSRLASDWAAFVGSLPPASESLRQLATRRFAVPSLFEQRCPHHVPRYVRSYREAVDRLAVGDTTGAILDAREAMKQEGFEPARALMGRLLLLRSRVAEARQVVNLDSMRSPALKLVDADIAAVAGDGEHAARQYDEIQELLSPFALETRTLLAARQSLVASPETMGYLLSAGVSSCDANPRDDLAYLDWCAWSLARIEEYDRASRLINGHSRLNRHGRLVAAPAGDGSYMDDPGWRQRRIWQVRYGVASDDLEAAGQAASELEHWYSKQGDADGEAWVADRKAKIAWLRSRVAAGAVEPGL